MPTDPPPRRKWHLTRWLIVLIVATLSWGGWRAYTFRSALAQAKALGCEVNYTDPVETIRKNWKSAFKKATWLDGVTYVFIRTSEAFEKHLAIVRRLNPKSIQIHDASTMHDLSTLKTLPRLEGVWLNSCPRLADVEGLTNLSALKDVWLIDAKRLKNVDALKSLSTLRNIDISRSGLTPETVVALKAALPNAIITGP